MRTPLLVAGVALAVTLPPGAWALATTSTPDPAVGLPELPSVADEVDGLYDDEGCLVTAAGEADCSVRADAVDDALSHGPAGETRHLQGFVGSRWLGQVTGDGPTVVGPSVRQATSGSFSATGLARNEGDTAVDSIEVTARLLGADGGTLATESVLSPVHDVRPGEPVPFTLRSTVPAVAVADVEWSATATGGADGSSRAFAWTPYWERPAGGEPVELYLYHDGRGPRPHLLFGSVASVGDATRGRPEVVVAWLAPDGRVSGLASTPLRAPDGSPLDALEPGAMADALVVADVAPPAGAEALVWVQGS